MSSIFTKIINRELPASIVHETKTEIVILDIAPCSYGHTLVITKTEEAKLENLNSEISASLLKTVSLTASAIANAYGGNDYNIILNNGSNAGQEVPHVHFHVIPREVNSPFPFLKRLKYGEGEMQKTADLISGKIKELL